MKKLLIFLFVSLYSFQSISDELGVISLMYHRVGEGKYPSTNVSVEMFQQHLNAIEESGLKFIEPLKFKEQVLNGKKFTERYILLTVDDSFKSFYQNAWPILKEKKIPFILFVSTREVGKNNYMGWDQIREIAKEEFVHIGNHSHTHEYLVDRTPQEIKDDLKESISIFKKNLGYNSPFFSYPFGEYSLEFKKIVKDLNFKYAFGQHSGVTDESKDLLTMPRFPINEKYGEIKRFKSIINYFPLEYKKILPEEKQLFENTNPPEFKVEFFKEQKNLDNINCYSNEGDIWKKSKINFSNYTLTIEFREPFRPRRGRINCSLNDNGKWRWFGIQFPIKEN